MYLGGMGDRSLVNGEVAASLAATEIRYTAVEGRAQSIVYLPSKA
jgi:hypothetical protein